MMKNFRTFCQSINKFPIKTVEDEQNERLRKIQTFKASFEDFVKYINQIIEDKKKYKMNIFTFEDFVINENYKNSFMLTESVQSSIIRNLLTAVDTSNSRFTSFISVFKYYAAHQLAWDQIKDTDFEIYSVKGKYPMFLDYNQKFFKKDVAPEDKQFVAAVEKAIKNDGFSIYLHNDEVKAVSFGDYWYTFSSKMELNYDDPAFAAARKAKSEFYSANAFTPEWDREEYLRLCALEDEAKKAARSSINRWTNINIKSRAIWSQILVEWGVNKICVLSNVSKYNVSSLQRARTDAKKGMIDLTPEGLDKLAKENMNRYKKLLAEKKANGDSAFTLYDNQFMKTVTDGMKVLAELRSSREKILTCSSDIYEAAIILDTIMSLYRNFINESNDFVDRLATYQESGRDTYRSSYLDDRRKDMEKLINRFKEEKVKFDACIERIKAD